jgi:hypothetical protein
MSNFVHKKDQLAFLVSEEKGLQNALPKNEDAQYQRSESYQPSLRIEEGHGLGDLGEENASEGMFATSFSYYMLRKLKNNQHSPHTHLNPLI